MKRERKREKAEKEVGGKWPISICSFSKGL